MKTSLRLILNGTFDKFPKLRMILGHCGEYFPFIIDRVDNRFAWIKDDEVKMKHTVAYYFKNKNVVMTTSGIMSKITFECTKQAFGIDSIIFASDYPYECLANMMKFVKTLDLTEEEKEKLFHLNAEKYILS
jgi:predicted TIM-barrel fold metal-dependent hydrolase